MNRGMATESLSNQQSNDQISSSCAVSVQREQKKLLKTKLKFQRRVHKLETRIAHAISRKDPEVEHQARQDLAELLCLHQEFPSSYKQNHDIRSSSAIERQNLALEEVTHVFRQLLSSFGRQTQLCTKQTQNSKARNLLQHMTKGTQTSDMFEDIAALQGYVRKKFYGRAALVIKSLGELSPDALRMAPAVDDVDEHYRLQYESQRKIMRLCYDKLLKIERVCSIGCGPGNDVVGITSFLRAYSSGMAMENATDESSKDTTWHTLEEVMLLDFVVNKWKEAALNQLIQILHPQSVRKIRCESCDVTKPLLSTNQLNLLHGSKANDEVNSPNISQFVQNADIFLISYLLSETHDTWDVFFVQLVELAPVGALFYFAEPMAWQLHRLIRMTDPHSTKNTRDSGIIESQVIDVTPMHRLKTIWIDSSMHCPELQQMDGRAGGPAVLLAVKI